VGDQVLANVGATLRGVLRARDFAGRNGGEEFAVLLPDTEIDPALEIAGRVRAAVAEISLPGTDVLVTASIGVVGFPGQASTLDRLERLADAALYPTRRPPPRPRALPRPRTALSPLLRPPFPGHHDPHANRASA
jgi:diguanylate cyclase (GGDEF)-like protein